MYMGIAYLVSTDSPAFAATSAERSRSLDLGRMAGASLPHSTPVIALQSESAVAVQDGTTVPSCYLVAGARVSAPSSTPRANRIIRS